MKCKKADLILIAVIFCIALAGLGYWYLSREEGGVVVVTVGGGEDARVIAELPLNRDAEMDLDDGNGGSNHLVIRDGAAYVTEANCPDKVCVDSYRSGIRYDGESIICLPHKLVVAVQGGVSSGIDNVVK